jgi:hypothetical protein
MYFKYSYINLVSPLKWGETKSLGTVALDGPILYQPLTTDEHGALVE